MDNILKLIEAAGFVAVPFIGTWNKLNWYFDGNKRGTKAIFVAVAGIESAVLYSYLVWTEPAWPLVEIPIGWYFGLSIAAITAYYGLYSAFDGKVDSSTPRWVLPVALVSYICLLSAVGIFCAAALARHDYLILGGHVFAEGKAFPGATLDVKDSNGTPMRQVVSDARGRFLLTLKYSDYLQKEPDEKPARLLVKAPGYPEQSIDLDGHPNEHIAFSFVHAPSHSP